MKKSLQYHFDNPNTEILGPIHIDKGPTFGVWSHPDGVSLWRPAKGNRTAWEHVEGMDCVCAVILARQLLSAVERVQPENDNDRLHGLEGGELVVCDSKKVEPYREGAIAGTTGMSQTECPYDFDTAEGQQWLEGFRRTGGAPKVTCNQRR